MTAQAQKVWYLDNLKVFMTALVIVHHGLVTYGGPGSWYYNEPSTTFGAVLVMTIVVATNQAFFMGFFFFISALFTESSLEKKGKSRFIRDRLYRFGIPLLFYTLLLGPVMNYLVSVYGKDRPQSFLIYLRSYDDWIDFGVLWFVAALLFFSLCFAGVRSKDASVRSPMALPSTLRIISFSVLLGVISFVVRIFFPVGWTLRPLGWQLGHFPQYVAMFCLGIVATRNNWLSMLEWKQGKPLAVTAVLMIVIGFPVIYITKTILDADIAFFSGGLHGESLLYGIWEQVTGISIVVALLAFAKTKWNTTTNFLKVMARSSFAVYIIHPFFLISISLLLKSVDLDPAIKLLICLPPAIAVTFLAGRLIILIPGVNKVV